MAHSSRRIRWLLFTLIIALPIAALLLGSTLFAVIAGWRVEAWQELFSAPGLASAIGMTLWIGFAATFISWWASAWLLSRAFAQPWWPQLTQTLAPLLATPHAAFAVGWVFLVAPSGWLLRSVSPWLTGWQTPPQIASSQDQFGLGLIAVLVFKEIPFLLLAAATQLQRDDTKQRLQRETWVAQSLGYDARQAFWLIVWPQLSTRLWWPLLAVLAYSLTVVDTALIAGPGSPSTLSVRAWQWLQDSDELSYATGAVAGWLMAFIVAASAGLWAGVAWLKRQFQTAPGGLQRLSNGVSRWDSMRSHLGPLAWCGLIALYVLILLALIVASLAGIWPFPKFWPESISTEAWQAVFASGNSIWLTLSVGITSSALALLWSVAWLEFAPARADQALRRLLYLPLLLPGILLVVGVHRITLATGLSGTWIGVTLAHLLFVLPYTLIALSPAYQGFDVRYEYLCSTLGKTRWQFLRQIKWPLLRQSLWSAAAVGFAVSVAQFLPTLFIGEGRISTVTTEAVTRASGGQRGMLAAFAWLQWILPVLAFAAASWLGQPRKFRVAAKPIKNAL